MKVPCGFEIPPFPHPSQRCREILVRDRETCVHGYFENEKTHYPSSIAGSVVASCGILMAGTPDSSSTPPTRELAAIMFSDIAGYTAIMGRDEQAGLEARNAHRDLLRGILPRF